MIKLLISIAFLLASVPGLAFDPSDPIRRADGQYDERYRLGSDLNDDARPDLIASQGGSEKGNSADTRTGFSQRLAPLVEPLRPELVGVLFERVNRRERIEFELLCQALVGPHATLRAYAATLLGESGDKRAIPFLIDALSDDSVHVGASYVDPGDATTRHRAKNALKKVTGQDFGFRWSDSRDEREAAIRRWVAWYTDMVKPDGPTNAPPRP